ncbi:MAG: arsenite methyltransferase [Chloroflexota bacterium]
MSELYSESEIAHLPHSAKDNFFGCGNPVAVAELKEGEVVLDLGSGAGLDCFVAAQKVGTRGKVIGLDMTLEMIRMARENACEMGLNNVEFRLGEIEHIPLEAKSVDVVISNCVINLSPDKDAVFREAFRVLRHGGRLMVSDIVAIGELPPEIKNDPESWASCIAGALPKEEYLGKIGRAGFKEIAVIEATPWVSRRRPEKVQQALADKLASIKVRAVKKE